MEHEKRNIRRSARRRTKKLTRAIKEQSEQEDLKSAISDHCQRNNHIMDWDNARVIMRKQTNSNDGSGRPSRSAREVQEV